MTPARINHVALTVADRDASAAFYAHHFGLVERVHDDAHLLIVADGRGGLLALSQGNPEPAAERTTHFGLQLESADAVRELRETFAVAGVDETEWQEDGPTRVQVRDPDGYRVEAYGW